MIFFGMLLILFNFLGVLYLASLYLRGRLVRLGAGIYRQRPVALFYSALGGIVVTAILFVTGVAFSGWVPLLGMLVTLLLFLMGIAGCLAWVIDLIWGRRERRRMRDFERAHPLPRLQFWMQDLYAVAIYFAIHMAAVSGFRERLDQHAEGILLAAAYLLLACLAGFYFALDVCRRSGRLQRPLPRALFILSVLLYTSLLLLIPGWVAWRAWRYALYRSGELLGWDLSVAERTAEPVRADEVETLRRP